MIFSSNVLEWTLSGTQNSEILMIFDYVVDENKAIKDKELISIKDRYIPNFLYFLNNGGKDFLLESLRNLQPKSFDVLNELASNYQLGFIWDSIIPAPHLPKTNFTAHAFFEVMGRLIFIHNPIWPEKPYGGVEEHDALPDVIKNSWLKCGAGWGIGRLPLPSTSYRQLIGNYFNWQSAESILHCFDDNWLSLIQQKIPDVYVTHYNPHDGTPSEWCSMRCFLDTRPYGLDGKCGDQFFIIDSRTDKVVYHIHDGDLENLRVLIPEAVGEAMDQYCAHTLMRTAGRFDFLPYSRLL